MQTTVRTTIRIRQDLFEQARLLAFEKKTSLQDVINATLESGFGHITDLNRTKEVMKKIDNFREHITKKHGYINVQELVEASKKDQK